MVTKVGRSGAELVQVLPDEKHMGEAWGMAGIVCGTKDGGLNIGYWEFQGDQTIPAEEEGFEECFITLRGSAVFSCDGEIFKLEPGDIVLIEGPFTEARMWSAGVEFAYLTRNDWARPGS